MRSFRHLVLLLAALGVTLVGSQRADAQCRLCDQPTTQRPADAPDSAVQLQIESGLNFDQLILTGSGGGAATIRPDGSSGAEGIVSDVGPRAMVGTVVVHGEPNRAVRVELPRRIELYSLSGGRITLADVASDLSRSPRLDAVGNLSFRFGGRLIVTGDTDGQYRGELPITVEYADEASGSGQALTVR